MNEFSKAVMLQVLDHFWKEHLSSMDYLRQSVNLRGYAQKNPIQEFKKESFEMFTDLLATIDNETLKTLSVVSINEQTTTADVTPEEPQEVQYQHSLTDEDQTKPEKKETAPDNAETKDVDKKEEQPKMSTAQHRALLNLSRRRNISVSELESMALDAYGTELENLCSSDASAFIRNLQQAA